MNVHHLVLAAFAATICAHASPAVGQRPRAVAAVAQWALEEVRLDDGKILKGLIESEDNQAIEFVQVLRPRGRPMFLVVRTLDKDHIESQRKLEPSQREILIRRINMFRNRVRINRQRLKQVHLTQGKDSEKPSWDYQGKWFSLHSTTDQQTTRRCIVRLEQIFTAFRQILPPRIHASETSHETKAHRNSPQKRSQLNILFFGSVHEYRQYLQQHLKERKIENPAIFLPAKNLIVAGSDLSSVAADLAIARERHRRVRQQYKILTEEHQIRIQNLRKIYPSRQEWREVKLLIERRLKEEIAESDRKIKAAERKNETRFDRMTARMFTRLYHEAFHAYLENYVFPHTLHDVPLWLNEGLAQVLEAGQMEADMLRIDAPNPEKLVDLQNDLKGRAPLDLVEILSSGQEAFLVKHARSENVSVRHYIYAWGLAHYLTMRHGLLARERLDEYVSSRSKSTSPADRFEKLVGMPVKQFQKRWRKAILRMKPAE